MADWSTKNPEVVKWADSYQAGMINHLFLGAPFNTIAFLGEVPSRFRDEVKAYIDCVRDVVDKGHLKYLGTHYSEDC